MSFPSNFDMAAGVDGLSNVIRPFLTDPVWAPVLIPDIEQFAMIPPLTPFMIQRDDVSGPNGFVSWQFSEYFLKMKDWLKGTPRTPARGGYGGTLRLDVKTVQATEELSANELYPFTNADVLPFQQQEQMVTITRVLGAMAQARIRDRTDYILVPMLDNTFKTWDGLSLIHDDHTHPDGSLFSNNLTGGVGIPHMTLMIPPTRAIAGSPTVDEIYNELVFIMSYNSLIRLHISIVQKVQRVWDIEVVVKDPNTLIAMQQLNATERGRFVDPLISENTQNGFHDRISINYDTRLQYTAGEEFDYFVIPKLSALQRQPGEAFPNPLNIPVWNPVPRFLVFGVVRSADLGGPDTKYDGYEDPSRAFVSIWESWAVQGGLPEEGIRFRPA